MMETTRRDSPGLRGGIAAPRLGSNAKTLYRAATVMPCDRKGNFDPGTMADVMAWRRQCGADGVFVLGISGEFPSFS